MIDKIRTFLEAETSLRIEGPVSSEVFESRASTCQSCESLEATEDSIGACKSCGCPDWQRSRLSVKLTMPKAECPLGKWKKSQGVSPLVVDSLSSKVFKVMRPR